MFWTPLPSLPLATGQPKSSGIFNHWVDQHPLLVRGGHGGTFSSNKSSFRTRLAGKHHELWQGLHVYPQSAPSKAAELCTYRLYALDSPSPAKSSYCTAHPPPPQGCIDLFLDLAHTLCFRTLTFWAQCPQVSGSIAPTLLFSALPKLFARP